MVSIGAMVGLRGAIGMLLGATVARAVLSPWLVRVGVVPNSEYGSFNLWLVWPALGLLVAGSFLPLLLDWGAIVPGVPAARVPAPPLGRRRGRGRRRDRRRGCGRRCSSPASPASCWSAGELSG